MNFLKKYNKMAIFFSGIVLISGSLYAYSVGLNSSFSVEEAPKVIQRTKPQTNLNTVASYYNSIKYAKKTVVNISTEKKVKTSSNLNNMFNDDIFKFFFREMIPKNQQERVQKSLGSGVIISQDGYIVTNNHVVENSDSIVVTLPDNTKEYKAKLIGTDPKTDIAVIKIEAENLNSIKFANSSDAKIGDIVFAIGNPFGIGETVTQGIVSALNRSGIGINEYENFIQTDASINVGNSGGALVDSRGFLVGINTAILSRSGGNHGIGFAIPSNSVKRVASSLIKTGSVKRAYLGIHIGNLSSNLAKYYSATNGALILKVEENLPADKYGLKRGDLITKVNETEVKDSNHLRNLIGMLSPNDTVKIEFIRQKETKTVFIKLNGSSIDQNSLNSEKYKGLSLIENNQNGLLVENVAKNSEAEKSGIKKGDIIVQIDHYEINSIKKFKQIWNSIKGEKLIYILRKNNIYVVVL
jgi:serine protease Do